LEQPKDDQKYRAPALDKGLDILELLAREPGGMTRSEIVTAMGRRPGEIYRMLERLIAREYVVRSVGGDRYAISMKLFLIGSSHPPMRRLTALAEPLMDLFANKTLQSIHLSILEGQKLIVVAQSSSPAQWEFKLRIGAELGLFDTGSGLTIMAFLDDLTIQRLTGSDKSCSPTLPLKRRSKLQTELDEIKKAGLRASESGQLKGVIDISVPILGPDGNAIAVITCPFIERVKEKDSPNKGMDLNSIQTELLNLAEKISIR